MRRRVISPATTNGQQRDYGQGDLQYEVQETRTNEGQHNNDGFRNVSDRGQSIERKRGEPLDRSYLLLTHLAGAQWSCDKRFPD